MKLDILAFEPSASEMRLVDRYGKIMKSMNTLATTNRQEGCDTCSEGLQFSGGVMALYSSSNDPRSIRTAVRRACYVRACLWHATSNQHAAAAKLQKGCFLHPPIDALTSQRSKHSSSQQYVATLVRNEISSDASSAPATSHGKSCSGTRNRGESSRRLDLPTINCARNE